MSSFPLILFSTRCKLIVECTSKMSSFNHLKQGRMLLHKVVILGDGGVGKTAITNQFVVQYYVETVGSPLWYELRDENR